MFFIFFSFVTFLKAQLKRKVRNKSKWHVGNRIKRRKLSQAKDNSQTAMNNQISDTEESQHTSAEPTELGNIGESSMEEKEKQHASESNMDLKHNSSTSNTENEHEESNHTTECTELRKERVGCNGDDSSFQVVDIADENESKGKSHLKLNS